ncbi:MAG: DNA polymerase III subunit delta [Alphaproteobacteria bacterium]|nr:DNA polymerase III subunit delta [Alphaproteobacteria bacterium]
MKFNSSQINGFINNIENRDEVKAILFHGFDVGLISDLYTRATKALVPDNDPFRTADLSADILKDEPSKLYDEAFAMSLTGGRRVVRIANAGNTITKMLTEYLENGAGDALVLLSGSSSLTSSSSLVKLFQNANNAAVVPCYFDEGASLDGLIRDEMARYGIKVSKEAMDYLSTNLGGDRLVSKGELEKLSIYMGDEKTVSIDDAEACVGDTANQSMMDLTFAVSEGNHVKAQHLLDRLYNEGMPSVAIIRSLIYHFQKIFIVASGVAGGKNADQAVASLRPPVNFKYKSRFTSMMRAWDINLTKKAMSILSSAELDCKTTGMPDKEICGRAVLQITGAAAMRLKRGRR